MSEKRHNDEKSQAAHDIPMAAVEAIHRELVGVENIDDFFGKDEGFARLFGEAVPVTYGRADRILPSSSPLVVMV